MKRHVAERAMRWSHFKFLIVVTLAIAAWRIAVVTSFEGDTAFLSANDRSRWCTVASLVEHGTYEIDKQIAIANPVHRNRHPWQTIDKVQHRGDDGQLHYYSSKPPLFPTMVAGVYWVLHEITGMTMTAQPRWIPRIVLALVNLPLLGIFLWSTIKIIDHVCRTRWGKYIGAVAACFGTMLLPFSITLGNHLPAAAAIAVATAIFYFAAETLDQEFGTARKVGTWLYFVAGLAIAMAAANELPALSMAVFLIALFYLIDRSSLLPISLGLVVVLVAFFGTNWIAHRSLKPAYAHRGDGLLVLTIAKSDNPELSQSENLERIADEMKQQLQANSILSQAASIEVLPSNEAGRWRLVGDDQDFALLDRGDRWAVHIWDDWYEYPHSYWQDGNRRGVDKGEPSRLVYFFHMTIGHHGIFSLTPLYLLVPWGMWRLIRYGPSDTAWFAIAVLVASVVCILFYLMRPMIDRNYGGVSTCFRWLLWFTPLWLLMVAVVFDDWSHRIWGRCLSVLLLALSVLSMTTALSSPWQSPWIYQWCLFLGWSAS